MTALRPYQREAVDAVPRRIGKKIDHSGRRFGLLVAVSPAPSANNQGARWTCQCDCGREAIVTANNLVRGRAKSCGCATKAMRVESCRKHGHTAIGWRSGTYGSWFSAIQRCRNSRTAQFSDYGGRGIIVCERWKDFRNFLADMGERPDGHSLDRINPDGNYEPTNCRWATAAEQSANQRIKVRNSDALALLAACRAVIAERENPDAAIDRLEDAVATFLSRRASC